MNHLIVFILVFFTLLGQMMAQFIEPIILDRLSGPITLNGVSDEPAWQRVQPFDVVMHQPVFGNNPSEKTEIRVAYDEEYLYASGRFYDSDPKGIRGNALERDGTTAGDDGFGFILDPFNDNENALCFATTPAGIRGDWTIFNDAEPTNGFPMNMSWNTYWDVAVIQNEEGWFAEMRIPFSSLRFQEKNGNVIMGLITWRYIARKNEIIIFPDIPPKWELSFLKPSVAQDVVLERVQQQNPLYITPYLLGGVDQLSELNNTETAYDVSRKVSRNIGLDLKYGLSSNLTLDLTFNTDFAQVESDDQQINITRFSLFYPEKRLFFQERASLFNFSFGGPTQMFYTRRIGLYDIGDDDYRQVPIYAGTRLVGRIGNWDVGVLNMQTAQKEFSVDDVADDSTIIVHSENFGVFRLRRQVINPYSYIGTMLTSRVGRGGQYNYCMGLDGTIKLFEDDYLTFSIAQSLDSEEDPSSPIDANRLRLGMEKRSKQGFSYQLFFARRGPNYIPRMGFEVWENYFVFARSISYAWLPSETSVAFRNTLSLEYYFLYGNVNRGLESAELGPVWTYEGKNGSSARMWIKSKYEALLDTLELPEDVIVPPDQYTFYDVGINYNMSSGTLLRSNFNITGGSFYDGSYLSVGVSPSWTVSKHLTLSGNYQPTWAQFSDRGQSFTTHLLGLRLKAAVNTKLSTSTFLQYNSAADAVGINFRLRYNHKEGTDFYLVYNEGLNTDRERETPALLLSNNRTVLLKYAMTFLP